MSNWLQPSATSERGRLHVKGVSKHDLSCVQTGLLQVSGRCKMWKYSTSPLSCPHLLFPVFPKVIVLVGEAVNYICPPAIKLASTISEAVSSPSLISNCLVHQYTKNQKKKKQEFNVQCVLLPQTSLPRLISGVNLERVKLYTTPVITGRRSSQSPWCTGKCRRGYFYHQSGTGTNTWLSICQSFYRN